MTLNITLLTPNVIYQSSDYRLYDEPAGRPIDVPSTKSVVVTNLELTGFITYTGIGSKGGKSTAQVVTEWLKGSGDDLTFVEVGELLRHSAPSWVPDGQPHTFVLASFVDSIPTAAVISNFERWQGAEFLLQRDFVVTTVSSAKAPKAVVTGRKGAVSRHDRRNLERTGGKYQHDPGRVRRVISELNTQAAVKEPDLISSDCFVVSQDLTGKGTTVAFGETNASPSTIMGGVDMMEAIWPFLEKEFGPGEWRFVQGASARSSTTPEVAPAICEQRQVAPETSRYMLRVLDSGPGRRAQPRSANGHGFVVGNAAKRWRGPAFPCYWSPIGELTFLGDLGGFGGSANSLNEAGVIVGGSEVPDRPMHAMRWDLDGGIEDFGAAVARHSEAKAINERGDVAGWISVHTTEGGQKHFRPSLWTSSGDFRVARDLGGAWGQAVDIDESGWMPISIHRGMTTRGALWNGEVIRDVPAPPADIASFFPKRIMEDGAILGEVKALMNRLAASVNQDDDWRYLVPPTIGITVTAAARNGMTSGRVMSDSYGIPWMQSHAQSRTALPYLQYHHHYSTGITEGGVIVGTASADYCSHPLIWTPK